MSVQKVYNRIEHHDKLGYGDDKFSSSQWRFKNGHGLIRR